VRFLYCAKLSKKLPTGQYTWEKIKDKELLQDPGGGRDRLDPENLGKSNDFASPRLATAIEPNGRV
jgi:hypothetical protein